MRLCLVLHLPVHPAWQFNPHLPPTSEPKWKDYFEDIYWKKPLDANHLGYYLDIVRLAYLQYVVTTCTSLIIASQHLPSCPLHTAFRTAAAAAAASTIAYLLVSTC